MTDRCLAVALAWWRAVLASAAGRVRGSPGLAAAPPSRSPSGELGQAVATVLDHPLCSPLLGRAGPRRHFLLAVEGQGASRSEEAVEGFRQELEASLEELVLPLLCVRMLGRWRQGTAGDIALRRELGLAAVDVLLRTQLGEAGLPFPREGRLPGGLPGPASLELALSLSLVSVLRALQRALLDTAARYELAPALRPSHGSLEPILRRLLGLGRSGPMLTGTQLGPRSLTDLAGCFDPVVEVLAAALRRSTSASGPGLDLDTPGDRALAWLTAEVGVLGLDAGTWLGGLWCSRREGRERVRAEDARGAPLVAPPSELVALMCRGGLLARLGVGVGSLDRVGSLLPRLGELEAERAWRGRWLGRGSGLPSPPSWGKLVVLPSGGLRISLAARNLLLVAMLPPHSGSAEPASPRSGTVVDDILDVVWSLLMEPGPQGPAPLTALLEARGGEYPAALEPGGGRSGTVSSSLAQARLVAGVSPDLANLVRTVARAGEATSARPVGRLLCAMRDPRNGAEVEHGLRCLGALVVGDARVVVERGARAGRNES